MRRGAATGARHDRRAPISNRIDLVRPPRERTSGWGSARARRTRALVTVIRPEAVTTARHHLGSGERGDRGSPPPSAADQSQPCVTADRPPRTRIYLLSVPPAQVSERPRRKSSARGYVFWVALGLAAPTGERTSRWRWCPSQPATKPRFGARRTSALADRDTSRAAPDGGSDLAWTRPFPLNQAQHTDRTGSFPGPVH